MMMRFAEVFPDTDIVHAVRAQLSWTHLRELIAIDDPLKRQFYTELCRIERWSTRTLKDKMDGMLFERTAIAKRPAQVVEQTGCHSGLIPRPAGWTAGPRRGW